MEESDVLSDLLSGKEAKINTISIETIQCVNDIRGEVGLGLRSNVQFVSMAFVLTRSLCPPQ